MTEVVKYDKQPVEITVVKRSADYKASLTVNRKVWGCGKTVAEATGDLVQSHPVYFGIKIKLLI